MATEYLPFDPNPRRPKRLPPRNSCDSQFHVLGPADRYPVRPGAAYEMPSATWEAALRMHRTLGNPARGDCSDNYLRSRSFRGA